MAFKRERRVRDEIASERIAILFEQAQKASHVSQDRADYLVSLANKISMRCRSPIPPRYRVRFCRKCMSYFRVGNHQTRLKSHTHKIQIKCLRCGYSRYKPYKAHKKTKVKAQ
jgi:ribonuclease P protein subunit RPR2